MNVYDFDNTIYDGDSSVDFTEFCIKRKPSLLRVLPRWAASVALHAAGLLGKTEMKEAFFSYLALLPATPELIEEFWDRHMGKIKPFYLRLHRPDDVVASASPEFLLAPACERMGIRPPVASKVDPTSGKFLSPNCRGEEKLKRLLVAYPAEIIEHFYSDGKEDAPCAHAALEAFKVNGDDITPWH